MASREPKDYLIFALDAPDYDSAMGYVDKLSGYVGLFKVGLELFVSEGPEIVRGIKNFGGAEVFLDLKLNDIPVTVARAFSAACKHGVRFVTIHSDAGEAALVEACQISTEYTKILCITVLTSMDSIALQELGYAPNYTQNIYELVLNRAKMAKRAGCHGIVCSAKEVQKLRADLGHDFVMVTPGIRPSWSQVNKDDQKRVLTPGMAVELGADYIVVGRPIRDAASPQEAAKRIADEIAHALEKKPQYTDL